MTNRDFCIIDTWKQVARCTSRSLSVKFFNVNFYFFRLCKSVWLSTVLTKRKVFSGLIWKVLFNAFCFQDFELTFMMRKRVTRLRNNASWIIYLPSLIILQFVEYSAGYFYCYVNLRFFFVPGTFSCAVDLNLSKLRGDSLNYSIFNYNC